ncbi:MAG: peptidoglycan-binding protein [Candidatus Paceibacterota bacterium]
MKKNILALFLVGFLLAPVFSFAQTGDIDPNPIASNCVALQNNLRYKDRDVNKNGEISTLQDFLQSKGYLNNEPTGYFGLLTFKAVKDFQKSNDISPTGYVGAITRAKIKALSCDEITPQPNEQKFIGLLSPVVSTTYMWGTHTLTDVVVECYRAPCPSKSYPVKAKDSEVLSNLKSYENSRVTIVGQLVLNNFEGGFYGIVASKVIPLSPPTSINPVISGVSGPQKLDINQTGTWTVSASSSTGGNLSYSVDWGEVGESICLNGVCATSSATAPQQTATFTHSYLKAGIYTPKFKVSTRVNPCQIPPCSGGLSAEASLSVNVGNTVSINHNPVINPIVVPTFIQVGKSVDFNFSATDADNDNLGCWTVYWGEESPYIVGGGVCSIIDSQQKQGWTYNTSHTWNTAGTYNVKVTVSDSKGGSASSSFSVNVDHLYVLNSTDDKNDNQESNCKKITITLKRGIEDYQVKCLQKMLLAKGFKIDGIEKGMETTFFGSKTLSALKEFQVKNQLKADGIFGPSSREALEKMEQE